MIAIWLFLAVKSCSCLLLFVYSSSPCRRSLALKSCMPLHAWILIRLETCLSFFAFNNGSPIYIFCSNLHSQVMRIALLLLLLGPLACLAAPIERPSSPYYVLDSGGLPSEESPTCYRRWRHHGHLTFRLARVRTHCRMYNEQKSSTNRKLRVQKSQSVASKPRATISKTWTV